MQNLIAVGSGKGGVGKTTVAVNLAIALAKLGHEVGLLDADVYGPNVPLMMGVRCDAACDWSAHSAARSRRRAADVHGFSESGRQAAGVARAHAAQRDSAVSAQRGLGTADYLVIDFPPGTGDVQLTLIQTAPLTGAIIVTTPSDVSLEDARKAVLMFEQVREPLLGIVENMSYLQSALQREASTCSAKAAAQKTAEQMDVPLLAELPLDPQVREGGDTGKPIATSKDASRQMALFEKLAQTVIERAEASKQKARPTITVAGLESAASVVRADRLSI